MHHPHLSELAKSEIFNSCIETPLPYFLARELHDAILAFGTECIIDVFASISNNSIKEVAEAYHLLYGNSIHSDLSHFFSLFKNFEIFCNTWMSGERPEHQIVDVEAACQDANNLINHEADYDLMLEIFTKRSSNQLLKILEKYEETVGHSLKKLIRKKFSGAIAAVFLATICFTESKVNFFAERLFNSLACNGIDEKSLVRIVVTRFDNDLKEIETAFRNINGQNIEIWLKEDVNFPAVHPVDTPTQPRENRIRLLLFKHHRYIFAGATFITAGLIGLVMYSKS